MRALIFACGLTLAASSAAALPLPRLDGMGPDARPQVAANTADYIRSAAAGDLTMIGASKVALERARVQEVRRFAQSVLNDRGANQRAFATTLASPEFSMTLPQSLDQEQIGRAHV